MKDWIDQLYSDPDMLAMGHLQRSEDANLGLGWIYYGTGRTIRPKTAVVIGSWRGFVPMVIAKALQDNGEGGRVIFIDPSLADDFWADASKVQQHFEHYGLNNIDHSKLTTEAFTKTDAYQKLGDVGLLFVDGFHDAIHAKIDYEAFKNKLSPNALTFFHDSVREFVTYIYGKENSYTHDVFKYMEELEKDPELEVMNLPYASGVTMVRKKVDADHESFFPTIRKPGGYTNLDD